MVRPAAQLRRLLRTMALLALARAGASADTSTDMGAADGVFVSPQRAWTIASEAGGLIVDVRPSVLFVFGHPAGAVQTPWQAFSDPAEQGRLYPDMAELSRRVGALGVTRDRPVLVLGQWDEGWGEEGRIFWMLEYLGHPAVHIIAGGYDAWLTAGLPLALGRSRPEAAAFEAVPVPERLAVLAEVAAGGAEIIDTRTAEEYAGATPWGSERGGHIPGARHLAWRRLVRDDGGLLPDDELTALLPPNDGRTITYCTGGVRSAFVYAVLRHLGRTNVANYAGSWWEYARSSHPVAEEP